jgi:hypothetical protein
VIQSIRFGHGKLSGNVLNLLLHSRVSSHRREISALHT